MDEAVEVLSDNPLAAGVWLVGSLGRADGDGFSDVDLIVAIEGPVPAALRTHPFGGLGLPGTVLFVRPKPRNAPDGGAFLSVCLEMAGLPVLVDMYLWPSITVAVPTGSRVLMERGRMPRSKLGLLDLLALCPPTDTSGSDPDDPATLLLLVQLAAKYHARGDRSRRAAICNQLNIPDITIVEQLRHLLDDRLPTLWPASTAARTAVDRLFELVSTLGEGR
ncbi:hypothetical protein [Paractinoplanes toevensis]|uniref:hypothetical protein n=1 Tax=Paractinoplanes toevensis TaxID=571911 RepID=UPI001BB3F972|nr:hypothetical protein [Actinoplanes toevensis]